MPLHEKARSLIHLILRSSADQNGWCKVSDTLAPLVTEWCGAQGELFEMDHEESGFRVRLSERGKIVSQYI